MSVAIPTLPNTPSRRGAQLQKKKHRNNFTFPFRGYALNVVEFNSNPYLTNIPPTHFLLSRNSSTFS
jgi:hypothetical protein